MSSESLQASNLNFAGYIALSVSVNVYGRKVPENLTGLMASKNFDRCLVFNLTEDLQGYFRRLGLLRKGLVGVLNLCYSIQPK
jgi:hypothetical protein